MTYEIIDTWAPPRTKFPALYDHWCKRMGDHEFFHWVKTNFPDIINIEEYSGSEFPFPSFKYTFESEQHYHWFLLQQ